MGVKHALLLFVALGVDGVASAQERPAEQSGGGRRVILSKTGGDRASAYPMVPKLVRLGDCYLVTWLDVSRINQWALVDVDTGVVRHSGAIGPVRYDNHCGAAVVAAPDGTAHVLVGGHQQPFLHYQGTRTQDGMRWELVQAEVGAGATYPSLACSPTGVLHLAYRCRGLLGVPYPYHVMYAQWTPGKGWSKPTPLVRANVLEHTWTLHTLTIGADGTIHIIHVNTIPINKTDKYYGASHLYSSDEGQTWRQLGQPEALATPVQASTLTRLEGSAFPESRIEPHPTPPLPCPPEGSYYNQMVLSNAVADSTGGLRVLLLNPFRGTAQLARLEGNAWTLSDLPPPLQNVSWYTHGGQLAWAGKKLRAVVTIGPKGLHEWGPDQTTLARLDFDEAGRVLTNEVIRPPEADRAIWLPSLERGTPSFSGAPALLYTCGTVASRGLKGANNINSVETEVVLELGMKK
jgi:hypothetical protein